LPTMRQRIEQVGDVWGDMSQRRQALDDAIEKLRAIGSHGAP